MDEALAAYSALADKNRLRILCALRQSGELCACQIIELLGISGAAVSRHMVLLQQAGFCQSRKAGRWVYFSLVKSPYAPPWKRLLPSGMGNPVGPRGVLPSAEGKPSGHPVLENDRQNLRAILLIPADELCKMQRDFSAL